MIRWHCDGNKHKKRMKRVNWAYCTHRCQVNSNNNNSKPLENNKLKIIFSRRVIITQAFHHRTMIMSWANVFTSVAVNQVN